MCSGLLDIASSTEEIDEICDSMRDTFFNEVHELALEEVPKRERSKLAQLAFVVCRSYSRLDNASIGSLLKPNMQQACNVFDVIVKACEGPVAVEYQRPGIAGATYQLAVELLDTEQEQEDPYLTQVRKSYLKNNTLRVRVRNFWTTAKHDDELAGEYDACEEELLDKTSAELKSIKDSESACKAVVKSAEFLKANKARMRPDAGEELMNAMKDMLFKITVFVAKELASRLPFVLWRRTATTDSRN